MGLKGSFTVEACILVPFLLLVTVIFVYLGIYVYDKTLMEQDLDAAVSLIRDECFYKESSASEIIQDYFKKACKEHPYLAISDMKMSLEKKGAGTVLIMSGEWEIPIFAEMNRSIEVKRELRSVNPVGVMLITESIKFLVEEKDDNKSSIRTE